MINPSLTDILKEKQKVNVGEYPTAVAIKNISGFLVKNKGMQTFEDLKNMEGLTQEEYADIELAEIYLPLLARFKEGELDTLFKEDIKDILANKKKKGLN